MVHIEYAIYRCHSFGIPNEYFYLEVRRTNLGGHTKRQAWVYTAIRGLHKLDGAEKATVHSEVLRRAVLRDTY